MSIVYKCRHCGHVIGKLRSETLDESKLGFNQLSPEEKQEMIQHQYNGDVHVHVICENCEAHLNKYPYYHEFAYFMQ